MYTLRLFRLLPLPLNFNKYFPQIYPYIARFLFHLNNITESKKSWSNKIKPVCSNPQTFNLWFIWLRPRLTLKINIVINIVTSCTLKRCFNLQHCSEWLSVLHQSGKGATCTDTGQHNQCIVYIMIEQHTLGKSSPRVCFTVYELSLEYSGAKEKGKYLAVLMQ